MPHFCSPLVLLLITVLAIPLVSSATLPTASAPPAPIKRQSMNSTTSSNSTSGAKVGFQSNDNTRGTLDLVWSCLVALTISLWSVLHLNIPSAKETYHRFLWRKVGWMLVMLLAPELIAGWACREWISARKSVKAMRDAGYAEWSVVHGFFAGMGGFMLHPGSVGDEDEGIRAPLKDEEQVSLRKKAFPLVWRQLHALMVRRRGSRLIASPLVSGPEVGDGSKAVSSVVTRSDAGFIDIPRLTKEEIQDRSKSDWFVKGFACLQGGWLVVTCIARAIQKLPVSQLEIISIAYVFSAVVIYVLWWHKPFDVREPVALRCSEETFSSEMARLEKCAVSPTEWRNQLETQTILNYHESDCSYSFSVYGITLTASLIGAGVLGMGFCALHLAAWNFSFPSVEEKWVWRACCLLALALGLLVTIAIHAQAELVGMVLALIYCVARLGVVVEAAISLRAMPAEIYTSVSWDRYIPHM